MASHRQIEGRFRISNLQAGSYEIELRRYPRDWEVYVDVGGEDNAGGFQLAASIPDGAVPIDGPSMEWLREVVQRYLQSRQQRQ